MGTSQYVDKHIKNDKSLTMSVQIVKASSVQQ